MATKEIKTSDLFLFISMDFLQVFKFPLKYCIPVPLGLRALLHLVKAVEVLWLLRTRVRTNKHNQTRRVCSSRVPIPRLCSLSASPSPEMTLINAGDNEYPSSSSSCTATAYRASFSTTHR